MSIEETNIKPLTPKVAVEYLQFKLSTENKDYLSYRNKLIPDYFPEEVGVVGGMVGVIGGLGGFVCPILFGYLLEGTGLWSSCWMFMFALSLVCLLSLHYVVKKMMVEKHPKDMRKIEGLEAEIN